MKTDHGAVMTPTKINELHGKPVWTCIGCKTPNDLHWWNGLSVAICDNKECSDEWSRTCSEQKQQQEAYEAYIVEYY